MSQQQFQQQMYPQPVSYAMNNPPPFQQKPVIVTPGSVSRQQESIIQPVQQVIEPYQPGPMVAVVPQPLKLPREFQPNDYLIVTLVIAVACAVFNLTSLLFSIPAVTCSALAFEGRASGYYTRAKYLGLAAIILDMICVIWTLAWAIIITYFAFACLYALGLCENLFD